MHLHSIFDEVYIASPVSLVLVLTIILISIIHYVIKYKGVPPGPVGLPYAGYWPLLLDRTCHLQLDECKRKYGDIFSFTCFGRLFINLGTVKAIREAYVTKSDYFASRYDDYSILNCLLKKGVVFGEGEAWRNRRKFFLGVFKTRGMMGVKENTSDVLYDCIKTFLVELKNLNGKPIDITQVMALKCTSILRQTLFGEYGLTDEQILELNKFYADVSLCFTPKNFLLMGNFPRFFIYPFQTAIRNALKNVNLGEAMLRKIIENHKSTYDEENIRDLIDEYFKERNKRQKRGDHTYKYFTDEALVSDLVQFLGDGALTVAAFVSTFLKNVTELPEEQEKIYQEIMQVVGEDREPNMDDKSKLTYTNAFIMEAIRTSDSFPLFVSLECTEETTLIGYRIPKGAVTVTNIYSAHYDPDIYEEPHKFNPSRFIFKEGKRRPENPIMFGVGKRSCMGESFVMMQTFLFLTTIVKNLRLSIAKGNADNTRDILLSRHFLVHVEPRKKVVQ